MWLLYILLSIGLSIVAFNVGYHNGARDMIDYINEQDNGSCD